MFTSMPEGYLIPKIEAQTYYREAAGRLYTQLGSLLDTFGKPVNPKDPKNTMRVTDTIPLVDGWEVSIVRPTEGDKVRRLFTSPNGGPLYIFISRTAGADSQSFDIPRPSDDDDRFIVVTGSEVVI